MLYGIKINPSIETPKYISIADLLDKVTIATGIKQEAKVKSVNLLVGNIELIYRKIILKAINILLKEITLAFN